MTPSELLPETPHESGPGDQRRERRNRVLAGFGVGIVGAASLSTAVYQTITQSSTTVGLPVAESELDSPLPWAAPALAPIGAALPSATTITPTVADLDLRADHRPLPVLPAPAAAAAGAGSAAPDPRPARGEAAPRSSPVIRGDDRPSRPTSSTGGRPTTRPGKTTPGTTTPSTSPSTPSTTPSTTPTTGSSSEPSTPSSEPSSPSSEPPSGTPTSGSAGDG